ncbi:OmpA family protein [Sinorhizobium meliloti]|uniref:OmpA family protein n=1 Tax=Rhizobium meliloti TaxID=382 RepID=UPI00299EB632|nr:OmpA family protein [Sinorhizobium meliloti]MDW9674664.1 OmpA family protein [Sinorhizobium meliloti]MDW9953458.1 OmpA family protein [Sinorhizobium meliloti]MDX0388234.1 OmpA family protein [Sinorhizobium meliloti]
MKLRTASFVISICVFAGPLYGQEVLSTDEIVKGLTSSEVVGKGISQGLSYDQEQAIDEAAALGKSITVEKRRLVAEAIRDAALPAVDFQIAFDFDSADIRPDSQGILSKLAQAMMKPELEKARFLVNGHTDAKGTEQYNLDLSVDRAESVVAFLVTELHIDPGRLVPIGFGETELKNRDDGAAAVNRRVEVVNLTFK